MSNPEKYNFEEEYQKFTADTKSNEVETENRSDVEQENYKKELISEEKNYFVKFQGKAKSIARFLILLTVLTFTIKPEISHKGILPEKPKITIPEKKPSWTQNKDYQELRKEVGEDKTYALRYFRKFYKKPWAKEIISNLAEKDPNYILEHLDVIIDEPWSKDIILDAYQKTHNNDIISNKEYYLSSRNWGKELFAKVVKEDPSKMTFFDRRVLNEYRTVKDAEFQTLLDMTENNIKMKNKKLLFLMARDISEKKLTLDEAEKIVSNDATFLNYLASNPDNLNREACQNEIKNISLNVIVKINSLHNEKDSIRFAPLKNFSCQGLYTLLVNGSEELYTSSYNGAFDILMKKMKQDNIYSGNQLIERSNFKGFRTFIEMSSRYNRLNEFLATMYPKEKNKIMDKIINGIGEEKNALKEAVVVADIFGTIKDPSFISLFQKNTKDNYLKAEKENNNNTKVLYGFLASVLANETNMSDNWFVKIKEQYKIPSNEKITHDELFGQKGLNIQEYFFYNDEDGKLSFQDFLNSYKNDNNWQVEDKGQYVYIQAEKNGKKIEIFANKPESAETIEGKINEEYKKRGLSPNIIVHRGHSYHANRTIENIPRSAKLVFLGSCGGYNQISAILNKSPEAQIISTKGKGTGLINDPMLKLLNDEILGGKDIVWSEFWLKAKDKFKNNPDFRNYISPDKNQSLMFLRAYDQYARNK